jgi:hypothetical protein
MSESAAGQAGTTLSPEAYQEFENLVMAWLDQNQGVLELGGSGDIRRLASSVVEWLQLPHTKNDLVEMQKRTATGQC